jgi:tRNA-splicing ligase RtcB
MSYDIEEPGFTVPIKSWLPPEEIEPGAFEQLRNTAGHPEAAAHIAVMPDCHVGFGVTIGSVFPTANAVLPNAVGVDIGCGMCAVNTGVIYDRERMNKEFWRRWSGDVARNVPTGFNTHRSAQELGSLDRPLRAAALQPLLKTKAATQLGTLGGGNHFLEAQVDENDTIWLMVHSGSRNTGLRIAKHYDELAKEITARRGLTVGQGLESLPLDDQTGQDYLIDMAWATDFALESRKRMTAQLLRSFDPLLEIDLSEGSERFINIHHNFAAEEEHDGRVVTVHRKGATSAAAGQLGIIPGSMGAPSYIVRGTGNPESLRSCSHGAGRAMGRNVARKQISEAEFRRSLEGTYSKPSTSYIDEAPSAYKNIDLVIARQLDLIEIVHKLTPIITVKGDSRARED